MKLPPSFCSLEEPAPFVSPENFQKVLNLQKYRHASSTKTKPIPIGKEPRQIRAQDLEQFPEENGAQDPEQWVVRNHQNASIMRWILWLKRRYVLIKLNKRTLEAQDSLEITTADYKYRRCSGNLTQDAEQNPDL